MRFVGFIVLVLMLSCSSKQPDSIISRDKMIDILVDFHKTDATLMFAVNRGVIKANKTKEYYVGLFKKYNITKEEFDRSYKYYCQNMTDFEKMYNKVIVRLTKEKDSLNYQKVK